MTNDEMLDKIPEELKVLNNWVLWRLEKGKGKKPTKIPYQVTGIKANTTKPETWTSFNKAKELLKSSSRYSGLGFVFTNSGFTGIDLDNCIESGVINTEAGYIIEQAFSYTEKSQSGNGIHIIVKGATKEAVKKKEIEIYSEGRFFALTGDMIGDSNLINEGQNIIDALYDKYKGVKKAAAAEDLPEPKHDIDIEDRLGKAFMGKHGFKIQALYEGNWQGLYPSQSEADQALCNYLAYWLDKDFNSIDKAFIESKLYRHEKWDREDYKRKTIFNAIAACEQSYQEQLENEYNPIHENKGCYYKNIKNGCIAVTNFIIFPVKFIECIDDSSKSVIDTIIITQKKEKISKQYKATDFDAIANFDKATNDFRTRFTGTLQDLKYMKTLIFNQVETFIKGVNCGGMHFLNGEWYFIDNNGCINSKGETIENLILLNTDCISSDLTKYSPITEKKLKDLSKDLFNFNCPEIALSVVGYVAGLFLKEKLKKCNIKYSHLFYSGEAGAGKSETLENIIAPILGITNGIASANGCTKFAIEKMTSSNNTIPLVLDEFKPGSIEQFRVKLISNAMRDIYDWHTTKRGTEALKLNSMELVAPVVLSGEASSEETALIERSLLLTFSKRESKSEDRSRSYKSLKNRRELYSLGKSLLLKGLEISIEDIKKMHQELNEYVGQNIKVDRVRNTAIVTLMGLKIIISIFKDLGINFEKETGFEWDRIVSTIERNMINENLDGGNSTKSIVDLTIEKINDMFALEYQYLPKSEFKQARIDEGIMSIPLRGLYDFFTKYVKDYDIKGNWLGWKDFNKQLQKTDYCLAHNITVRFPSGSLSASGDIAKKSFKLDVSKMEAKGINLENIIEYSQGVVT